MNILSVFEYVELVSTILFTIEYIVRLYAIPAAEEYKEYSACGGTIDNPPLLVMLI